MYCLYPLDSIPEDSGELWLSYEWGDSFENREWRPCVESFLKEITALGYEVASLPSPTFTPGEDFVEIQYLVGGAKATFASDHLLSLITIRTEEPGILRNAWEVIGNKVGWAPMTTTPNPSIELTSPGKPGHAAHVKR